MGQTTSTSKPGAQPPKPAGPPGPPWLAQRHPDRLQAIMMQAMPAIVAAQPPGADRVWTADNIVSAILEKYRTEYDAARTLRWDKKLGGVPISAEPPTTKDPGGLINAPPRAFVALARKCVRLGLQPWSDQLTVVPRFMNGRVELQMPIMFQGLVEILHRDPNIRQVYGGPIHRSEWADFEACMASRREDGALTRYPIYLSFPDSVTLQGGHHLRNPLGTPPADFVGAVAMIRYRDATTRMLIVPAAEVLKAMELSQGGWANKWKEEFFSKFAIRRLVKQLPKTPETLALMAALTEEDDTDRAAAAANVPIANDPDDEVPTGAAGRVAAAARPPEPERPALTADDDEWALEFPAEAEPVPAAEEPAEEEQPQQRARGRRAPPPEDAESPRARLARYRRSVPPDTFTSVAVEARLPVKNTDDYTEMEVAVLVRLLSAEVSE